jgi:hypothetical protein
MQRIIFENDHEAYRETLREFLAREIEPTTNGGRPSGLSTAPRGSLSASPGSA